MCINQVANAVRVSVDLVADRVQSLVVRFGIASLPADILLSCDDIILALLAFRV